MFRIYLGLVFIIGVTYHAGAQQDTTVWSLEQCIEFALENNLEIKQGYLNMESGSIDLQSAKYSRYPDLNGNSAYRSSWGRSIDPTTNDFINVQSDFVNIGATSNLLLFNGFRIQNSIKQSNSSLEASRLDQEQLKENITLNVVGAYMNVIFNREQFENAQTQLNTTRQQLERTSKQVNAGALPKSNLLEIQAQESTNELNLINQENALNMSILQLKQILQLPATENIDVQVPELDVEEVLLSPADLENAYQESMENLPGIKSARVRVEASEYGILTAKSALYPRLVLFGGLTSNYSSWANRRRFISDGGDPQVLPTQIGYVEGSLTPVYSDFEVPSGQWVDGYNLPEQMVDNLSKYVGLSLNVPIFNGYSTRLNIQRAEITRSSNQINLDQAKNTLRQNIESAYYDLQAAVKSYNAALKQMSSREEAFRVTSQRYEVGAADFTEYQIAENDLFRAKSDLVRSKYDLIYKSMIIDYYQGKKLEF